MTIDVYLATSKEIKFMAIAETKYVVGGVLNNSVYGYASTFGDLRDNPNVAGPDNAFSLYTGGSLRSLYWTSGNQSVTLLVSASQGTITNAGWDDMITTTPSSRGSSVRTFARSDATFSQYVSQGTQFSQWVWAQGTYTGGNPFVSGTTVTVEWDVGAADTTPDAYRLSNKKNVAQGATETSYVKITGTNTATTATRVSGAGLFGVSTTTIAPSTMNGSSKTINPGEYLHVSGGPSSTKLKSTFTRFNIGGVTENWYITSDAAGTGSLPDHVIDQGIYYYGFDSNSSTTTTRNTEQGDTIGWTMDGAIGNSNNDYYQTYLNNVTASFSFTNCQLIYPTGGATVGMVHTQQSGVNGCIIQMTGASGSTYSATATFTHGTASSGNKTKTFTITGVIDPSDYGMEVFDSSGDVRMSMEKRQPRYHGSVSGNISNTPTTINIYYPGYGVGGLSQWHAVNTEDTSNYYVDGSSGNNYITLRRSDVRKENFSYQIISGRESYNILVFRF